MRWIVLGLLSLSPSIGARADDGQTIALKVGQSVDFTPGFLPAQVVCDDISIVEVSDGGDHFRVKGLRVGRTACGFLAITRPLGRRRVMTVIVGP